MNRNSLLQPMPPHGCSPAEVLFNRHIRTELQARILRANQEVRDRDAEQEMQAKLCADDRRGAACSSVDVCDTVLIQQEKEHHLTTLFTVW